MDGLSAAASVGTIVEISGKIVSGCWKHFQKVKSARSDIERLRKEILAFQDVAKQLQDLLHGPQKEKLVIPEPVALSLKQCTEDLEILEERVQARKMLRFGIIALKWPLTSAEIDRTITSLERHESSFNTVFNLNQMNVVLKLDGNFDRIEQERYLAMLPRAKNASFDSFTWQHEPLCHHDTRVELLKEIREWEHSTVGKCVFWLGGMAGTGKSTIACTVARQIRDDGRPCGTFFFSRGGGELTKTTKLWSTLAFSLAKSSSLLLNYILEAIMADNDIGYQDMREQWKQLIHEPLAKANATIQQSFSFTFIIDALDECDSEEDIHVILELLSLLQGFKMARLRVFVTSRPEVHIRLGFHNMPHIVYRDLILDNIDRSTVSHDIGVFLKDELSKIGARRKAATDWPGEQAINALVERADCLFIYAATACRYIGKSSRISPEKRLKSLLTSSSAGLTAERGLDKMYLKILNDSLEREYSDHELSELSEQFQLVVGAIVLLNEPLSVEALSKLLEKKLAPYTNEDCSTENLVDINLDPFASLLNVPPTRTSPIRILHPSFRDFLINKDRCTNEHFWVNFDHLSAELCQACLQVITDDLGSDLCNFQEPGILQAEIDGSMVRQTIPAHVQYACRYWIQHGLNARCLESIPGIPEFFEKNVLKWLEVVLLFGQLGDIISDLALLNLRHGEEHRIRKSLAIVARKSAKKIDTDFDSIVLDLLTFLKIHRATLEYAPYQLYVSALLQSPQDSVIRQIYQGDLPSWITKTPIVDKTWNASLQSFDAHRWQIGRFRLKDGTVKIWNLLGGGLDATLRGHKAAVKSVAISPTSTIVASASRDGTARIWAVKTGTCMHVLEGHTDVIQKIMISSQNNLVATSSQDGDVRLWDSTSGTSVAILGGEAGRVTDLAFSSDGEYLAAGYYDGSLCFWSPQTHSLLSKLSGHRSAVNTVLFSHGPRGHIAASGSHDRTIKIWSVSTGELLATLIGHRRLVKSISLSASGALLASASFDNTIKVWDVESGTMLNTSRRHKDALTTVTFSKTSEQTFASGGKDRRIRIWTAMKKDPILTLMGHSRTVNALTWAPQDGRQEILASASRDCTIRIWEPFSKKAVDTFVVSHSDDVSGIEISPDGQLLATRSKDDSVRLWNSSNGEMLYELHGHSERISTLVFSPNSQMIASGARDHNIFLRDVNGNTLAKMSGHSRKIVSLLFSPDNGKVASYAYDWTIKVWNLQGDMLCDFNNHERQINSIDFSSDSSRLVSASYDCTVGVYSMEKSCIEHTLKGHVRSVDVVCFSPDGKAIISGSKDRTVIVWDAVNGQFKRRLIGHTAPVSTLFFSPDSSKVISRADNHVNIWDTTSGLLLSVQNDIAPFVLDKGTSAIWSSDGSIAVRQVALGQADNQLRYRYVQKRLRLSSRSLEGAAPTPFLTFQAYDSNNDDDEAGLDSASQFAMSSNLQWITYKGQNLVFLPGHLRPRVLVVYGERIVVGNRSGRVIIFGFDYRKLGTSTESHRGM